MVSATALTASAACPIDDPPSGPNLIDFEGFFPGEDASNLGNGITVTAQRRDKRKLGPFVSAIPMIFDSENPTGEDEDLGTPNTDFGGSGVGDGGGSSSLFPNAIGRGNVLIVSEDDDSSDPDDNAFGGYLTLAFATPTDINRLGLLDNESYTNITVTTKGGGKIAIFNENGGDNSHQWVTLAQRNVVALEVFFQESGAVTGLETSFTDQEEDLCNVDLGVDAPTDQGSIVVLRDGEDTTNIGTMTLEFDPPADLASADLLVDQPGTVFEIFTSDGGKTTITHERSGASGSSSNVQTIALTRPSVTKLVVTLAGNSSLGKLRLQPLCAIA